MAGLDEWPLEIGPSRHDGVAACRLCASTKPDAGHEWCAASGGLICDECCRRVLLGDISRLRPWIPASDLPRHAEEIIGSCLVCERGRRRYVEHLHMRFSNGREPD